jgi:hypothetical protein
LRIDLPEEGPISASLTAETKMGEIKDVFVAADVSNSGIVTAIGEYDR